MATMEIAQPVYIFGRPTKFTPALASQIVQVARGGVSLEGCAGYVGITRQTLDNWRERGRVAAGAVERGEAAESTEEAFVDFFGALEKARSSFEAELILSIREAGLATLGSTVTSTGMTTTTTGRQWQALAWLAERMWPDRWGRRWMRMELTGRDGRPIEHADVTEAFTDAERWRRLRAACALVADGEVVQHD